MKHFTPAVPPPPRTDVQPASTPERPRYDDLVARALTYAQRLLPRAAARDLAHDVAVELLRDPDAPVPNGPIVYLAVTRRLRNEIRAERRRENREQTYVQSRDGTPAWARPDADLEVSELRNRIRDAVAEMPAGMRDVFLLVRVQRLSYKDVAARLGISVATVHTQLSRAAARLRECVRRYESDDPPSSSRAPR